MMQDDCSRRAFLKKFALLSAGTLVLGATTMACYGPGVPRPSLTVLGMYFLDDTLNSVPLKNNQNVPVQTKFTIEFSIFMNRVDATVEFTDQIAAHVPFVQAWDNDYTLSVVPSPADLSLNTQYRLRVLEVVSKQGETIMLGGEADATFKTAVV